MKEEMLPIVEAATLLETTPLNVLMHVKRGLLKGVEEAGGWLIERASLDALLASSGGKSDQVCASGCAAKHACSGGCS